MNVMNTQRNDFRAWRGETRYKGYDLQTWFQEKKLLSPQNGNIFQNLFTWWTIRPIILFALISLWSRTNHIVCFYHTLKVSGDTSLLTITRWEGIQLKGCVFSRPARGREARKRNLSIGSIPVCLQAVSLCLGETERRPSGERERETPPSSSISGGGAEHGIKAEGLSL